jgi:hypothetical protein
MRRLWWLHSAWALAFGIGVMVYARKGLRYADKLLLFLAASWIIVFFALRFMVRDGGDERLARKGLRLVTNYVIKNFYQQMLFFLVPFYAWSSGFDLGTFTWWLPAVLLVFAVLSTMDLVFDNFVMEHRIVAAAMYGVCMFGVLNLMLPLVFQWPHFRALLVAAGATAPAVALLSFRVPAVFSITGISVTVGLSGLLVAGAYYGRALIPPAPTALAGAAVGHGTLSSYECLPGAKREIRSDRLDGLRCVAEVVAPGGLHDDIVHVWRHQGREVFALPAAMVPGCTGIVQRSYLPDGPYKRQAEGRWSCTVETSDGQVLGRIGFSVVTPPAAVPGTGLDAGPSSDAQSAEDVDAE